MSHVEPQSPSCRSLALQVLSLITLVDAASVRLMIRAFAHPDRL